MLLNMAGREAPLLEVGAARRFKKMPTRAQRRGGRPLGQGSGEIEELEKRRRVTDQALVEPSKACASTWADSKPSYARPSRPSRRRGGHQRGTGPGRSCGGTSGSSWWAPVGGVGRYVDGWTVEAAHPACQRAATNRQPLATKRAGWRRMDPAYAAKLHRHVPRPRCPMTAAVQVRALRHTWPGASTPTLIIDALDVDAGQTLFLRGPSGSGKSTLSWRCWPGCRWPTAATARCACSMRRGGRCPPRRGIATAPTTWATSSSSSTCCPTCR